jgi:CheY-like chemotaxis protein
MVSDPDQSSKNSSERSSVPPKEQSQKRFREYLREADRLIKEGNFEQAKKELSEARKLEPVNSYLIAFEERISLFEKKTGTTAVPPPAVQVVEVASPAPAAVEAPVGQDALERKIRHKIEEEFKARFTHELRRAEEIAAKMLEEERGRFDQQRHILKSHYDQQLEEIQTRADAEYHRKLEQDVAQAEQRLRDQYQMKLGIVEEELKTQMSMTHETARQDMEDRLRSEREALLEQERAAFMERERSREKEFDQRLQDVLKKASAEARAQTQKEQLADREQLRQQLTDEFHKALDREREEHKIRYDALQGKLEESSRAELQNVREEYRRQLEEELQALRQREAEDFERKRAGAREETERELRSSFEAQIEAERRRAREESDALIETERKRLHQEYSAKLEAQEAKIRAMRGEIQQEMEQNFIKRMEQIAREYDLKMELLGTKIPQTFEEKRDTYRERLQECYAHGEPTVEEARGIMALKEFLELSFDDHLAVETDVRLELYVQNVERLIVGGELDMNNTGGLEKLKVRYRVSAEESAKLEQYLRSSAQRLSTKGRVLIVDDDLLMLQSLDALLTDSGFHTVAVESVDQALELLKTMAVDLILSDIKFADGQPDGFQFFISVQSQPHLRKVPFIFMSSLRDGVVIRSGIQLGADDYITKPIDPDYLVAAVEGKLKRYRALENK